MSSKESYRNALLILLLLIGFGAISAIWPILSGATTQSHTRVPLETEVIELPIPFSDPPDVMQLTSLQALGLLAGVVIAVISGAGVTLGLIYLLLSRQTAAVKESDDYQSNVASLEKKETARIKAMREGRKSAPMPAHEMPRWSIASTLLITLMFVAFFGLVINGTFFPENEYHLSNGELIPASWLTVGIPVLLALLIAFLRLRPQRLNSSSTADTAGIPWDFIAVLLTGLLIVGLGIGLMVYLNIPV